MSDYFLDSSALAKRYLSEVGTVWVRDLVNPIAGHIIWIAEIAKVEVASALAARQRAPQRDAAVASTSSSPSIDRSWMLPLI